MRIHPGLAMVVSAAVSSATFLLGLNAADAQTRPDPYKWCALYSGEDGGGQNCGFLTIEQCRDTLSGMGGWCVPNQFYTGGPTADRPSRKPARRHAPPR